MAVQSDTDITNTMSAPKHFEEETQSKKSEVENGTVEEFGYVPAYRRVFRSLGNVSMVVALTSPLVAILITGFYQVTYAGYWGLSWGWIIPNLIMFPQVLAISELTSSMPVNGAFYWWAGALAPPNWSHSVSFVLGWLNVASMFTATASFSYAVAASFSFAVNVVVPDFTWTNAQLMLLSMAIILLWAVLMSLKLENIAIVYISMAAIILVQTVLFIFGLPITHALQHLPFAFGKDVFGSFANFSDWGPAVAVPYSWFAAMWVNSAWMVPVYVAEETHRASTEVPKSIIYTFSVTALTGTLVCLLCAFCITDIEAAAVDITGYPLMNLIISHWGKGWTAAFFFLGAPVGFIGGSGTLLTYACQIAAFARDGGLPYSHRFATVHQRLNLPVYSVGLLTIGTFLILLLALSSEASSIIYSLAVVANLIVFIVPIFLRIFAGDRWVPGPFSLGKWSIPVHVFTVISQVYIITMECFPPYAAFDAVTMNYNFAVTLVVFFIACFMYWGIGEKYRGLDLEALASWRRIHGVHLPGQ